MPNVNHHILSPVNFLQRNVSTFPHKTAVIYDELKFTWKQFQDRVFRLANALKKRGIAPGDKVAFICPNTPPMLEAHYAVPLLGAALVSVNIRLSVREMAYIIDHSDAKAVFADTEFSLDLAAETNSFSQVETWVNICDVNQDLVLDGPSYEEFLDMGTTEPMELPIQDEGEVLSINYTSGTTGLPKGVMYHHRGAYLNALGEALEFNIRQDSVYLWTLPMFHCNGWCFTWGITAMGGTHVCLRKVEPREIYRLIEEKGVNRLCAAPTILIAMSAHARENDTQLSHGVEIMTAGAPPAPAIIENMESIGANITQTYGLTEVFGPHSICIWQDEWNELSPGEQAKIKARQGVPYVLAEYMDVVDPSTMEPVPRDGETLGEIVMQGNNVMLGYYKDEKATAEAFRGGWFHSGDLAVIHPNNYVQIMDRQKDIIISGGENISTVEIENTLYTHPAVMEVAVIPVPDPKWGEVPKAFIVPREGENPDPKEIIAYCKEKMARFKAPKYIAFGELPKTATGKIQKFKLREREWTGKDRMVN